MRREPGLPQPPEAEAFLDPIGLGTREVGARASLRRTLDRRAFVHRAAVRPAPVRGGPLGAAIPAIAALAALAIVATAGLSRRWPLPESLEPYAYGFFLDSYPLFAFALVYGLARIAVVAAGPGPGSAPRRVVFGLAGAALLTAAGLYPTFGGLILRGGFSVGGMAFLTRQPLWLAYALGAGAAAAAFGAVVGLSGIAANRPLRPRLARFGAGLLAFLALWWGAGVVGLARDLGLGPWPHRPLRPAEAGLAALLLAAAALPHAALVAALTAPRTPRA